MNIKRVRPYNSRIDAFRAIIKRELFAEAGRAKDRLKVMRERVEDHIEKMNLIDKDSEDYAMMQQTQSSLLASQERMEIAVAIWNKVIKIYSMAEEEYERLYATMKEEESA